MIKRIYISNFRSIQELEFFPENLSAIIGPNSSGKTNILKAIDLVIGEGWTTKAKVARELFNDPKKKIWIEIDLKEPIAIDWYSKKNLQVRKVTLEMHLDPLGCSVKLWENYPDDYRGDGYSVNEEFKKKCHFIYVPSTRDLKNEMRISNWTLLGKMMKTVYDNYIEFYGNEQKLKDAFEEKIAPAKEFLEHDFSEKTGSVSFKVFYDTFQKYCKANSAGLANAFVPHLNIYNLNWFYKTLQIAVHEEECKFDAEEVGAGVQNLILLSIFQTYAELSKGNAIFGFEEPEIYLYPHAQRELYKSFIDLSTTSQIFYTTHNPNFVDAFRAYEIEMVKKDAKLGTVLLEKNKKVVNPKIFEDYKFKIYTHFTTERNELFFANFVILVEGASDKILWATLLTQKWGIDINAEGISIIECGGKGGVIYFIGVMRLMGIEDFFAIWDKDSGDDADSHGQLEYAIKNQKALEFDPTMESFLTSKFKGFKFDKDKKVESAYEWASNVKEQDIPEELNAIKNLFVSEEIEEV